MPPLSRFVLAVVSIVALAGVGEARLASQRIAGANRVCVYEIRRPPGLDQAVQTKVGMGERCPFRYRRPSPPERPGIPAAAQLESARRAGGRTLCVYVRFGQRYSRSLPSNATCPQTAGAPD